MSAVAGVETARGGRGHQRDQRLLLLRTLLRRLLQVLGARYGSRHGDFSAGFELLRQRIHLRCDD